MLNIKCGCSQLGNIYLKVSYVGVFILTANCENCGHVEVIAQSQTDISLVAPAPAAVKHDSNHGSARLAQQHLSDEPTWEMYANHLQTEREEMFGLGKLLPSTKEIKKRGESISDEMRAGAAHEPSRRGLKK